MADVVIAVNMKIIYVLRFYDMPNSFCTLRQKNEIALPIATMKPLRI